MKKSALILAILIGLALLIIVPRAIYLNLGPDTRRLSDTNLKATALTFLQAAASGGAAAYFFADKKYTSLNGMIVAVPIAAYYGVMQARGVFADMADFGEAFALKETTEYFWIQAFMLALNALVILLILAAAKKYPRTSSRRSVLYALALVATSPYLFTFSTLPRIHSIALLFAALALFASLRLVKNKSPLAIFLAFGLAGLAFACTQVGFVLFVAPLLAYLASADETGRARILWPRLWSWGLVAWGGLGASLSIMLGYPRLLLALFNPGEFALYGSVLSASHPHVVVFGPEWITRFLSQPYWAGELAASAAAVFFLVYVLWWRRDHDAYEVVAAGPIVLYTVFTFPLMGFVSGYFAIVILPSLMYLGARMLEYAKEEKLNILYACLLIIILVQGVRIALLTRTIAGGESIYSARIILLAETSRDDRILGSFDSNVLGIPPSPESLRTVATTSLGRADQEILSKNLEGKFSRHYTYALPGDIVESVRRTPQAYTYIVLSEASPEDTQALCTLGYTPAHTIVAHPTGAAERTEIVSVHNIFDTPSLPFVRAIGPNITIYAKGPCDIKSP